MFLLHVHVITVPGYELPQFHILKVEKKSTDIFSYSFLQLI